MKKLTEIAVRLRVITTSLLSILGFIALGLLLGFWLGTHSPLGRQAVEPQTALAASAAIPNQKWCDAEHAVPFIQRCGGVTSCERAGMMSGFGPGEMPKDWNVACATINKQLQ